MRLAYTQTDGSVAIVDVAPKEKLDQFLLTPMLDLSGQQILDKDGKTIYRLPTEAEYRKFVMDRSIPSDAKDVQELPDDWQIPDVDRTFRDAWRINGTAMYVHMPTARELWKNKMRNVRTPKLEALDISYQQADETGDVVKKTDIVQQKQELRDVTADPAIEAAQTPEELKAIWPKSLI